MCRAVATMATLKYHFLSGARSNPGILGTDKKYTGQRLDGTGLYFYNARYYDAEMGRFVSADSLVQAPHNPQSLNRYSYVINNPLAYTDPTGHCWGRFTNWFGCGTVHNVA